MSQCKLPKSRKNFKDHSSTAWSDQSGCWLLWNMMTLTRVKKHPPAELAGVAGKRGRRRRWRRPGRPEEDHCRRGVDRRLRKNIRS